MRTKAINLLVDHALPEDMRDPTRQLDAKSVGRMLHMVASFHPEKYADITKNIGDIGRHAAYWRGATIGLDDLEDPIDTQHALREMDKQENALRKKLTNDPEGFKEAREALWHRTAATIERESMGAALRKNNSIGLAVASGARGKPLQLRSMLSTPAVFADSRGRTIPIFARRSYSQGVSPAEFLAGTHGARTSVIATKRATAKGGFLSKVLVQNAGNLVVTEEDCGTHNGIDVDATDPTIKLRFLAQDAAGLKSGDLLDRKATARLADRHKGTLLVRSALTCESPRGVCAKCIGADPRGKLRPIGFAAGVTAGQAIGEPITQGALNCLVAGTPVRMADGSAKAIETVIPGDIVLGASIAGDFFPVTVLAVHDQGLQPVHAFILGDKAVGCTSAHPLLFRDPAHGNVRMPAGLLPLGCAVATHFEGRVQYEQLCRVEEMDVKPCWDLSVDHPDELFVLANNLIVKNTKHVSGAASAKKEFSGFDVINRFVQVPDEFPDRAPVAEESGNVVVNKAPQGGHYVRVGETEHYVPAGVELRVKTHDVVEKGDVLADGLARADDIVRLRGLGSGRRYYAERLSKILEDSGMTPDRRNVEMIARAAINHVRIEDPDLAGDGVLPDDVVPYSDMMHNIQAPDDATYDTPDKAHGRYLYAPALHYTVGTQLTPRMTKRIKDAGITNVFTSPKAPGFHADMTRLQTATHANPDWLASLNTSYLQKQVTERAMRGQDTNIDSNINYAPRLAVGENFGAKSKTTGMF